MLISRAYSNELFAPRVEKQILLAKQEKYDIENVSIGCVGFRIQISDGVSRQP